MANGNGAHNNSQNEQVKPDEQLNQKQSKSFFKKLFQYFLQGLIILAPIVLTVYAVTALFNFIDNILPDIIARFFPQLIGVDELGQAQRIPGIGFVVVILTVLIVGYISSSFIVGRLVDLFDRILERTPGIKVIYSPLKDFFEAFAGNNRKFDKAVLVNLRDPEVWQIAFITQTQVTRFGLDDYISVYIPKSYALTGEVYFIKTDRVRILENVSSTEAMKFVISGGVTEVN